MKFLNKNSISLAVLLFVSLLIVPSLFAQQSQTSSTENSPKIAIDEQKNKTSNSKPTEKVFKPSEEISEDSPVPFPVDI